METFTKFQKPLYHQNIYISIIDEIPEILVERVEKALKNIRNDKESHFQNIVSSQIQAHSYRNCINKSEVLKNWNSANIISIQWRLVLEVASAY